MSKEPTISELKLATTVKAEAITSAAKGREPLLITPAAQLASDLARSNTVPFRRGDTTLTHDVPTFLAAHDGYLGKKYDGGKAPLFQGCLDYFPRALLAIANISKYGTEKYDVKYSDKAWSRVHDAERRYKDGRARHEVMEDIEGLYDTESNHLHAAHLAWNALAVLEMMLSRGVKERNETVLPNIP